MCPPPALEKTGPEKIIPGGVFYFITSLSPAWLSYLTRVMWYQVHRSSTTQPTHVGFEVRIGRRDLSVLGLLRSLLWWSLAVAVVVVVVVGRCGRCCCWSLAVAVVVVVAVDDSRSKMSKVGSFTLVTAPHMGNSRDGRHASGQSGDDYRTPPFRIRPTLGIPVCILGP